MGLIIHSPTAQMYIMAFGVWLRSVRLGAAIPHSVLYLHYLNLHASPKAISGRTSYLEVRLEFHRYPQVIQARFSVPWFGPPQHVTVASTCSWIDHLVSGLWHRTDRPIKTQFPYGSAFFHLALLDTITRRSILQDVRHHPLTGSD